MNSLPPLSASCLRRRQHSSNICLSRNPKPAEVIPYMKVLD
jgi:hypothetical protein